MVLPCLDVVLGPTARAVEPLVEVLGAATFQTGDDEPGIGSLEPGLDAGDDALDPAPALGGIVELPEAPHLAAPGRRLEARGGALLQRCDMTAECGVGGQAEDPIHPVLPAPSRTLPGKHNGCRHAAGSRPLANQSLSRSPIQSKREAPRQW